MCLKLQKTNRSIPFPPINLHSHNFKDFSVFNAVSSSGELQIAVSKGELLWRLENSSPSTEVHDSAGCLEEEIKTSGSALMSIAGNVHLPYSSSILTIQSAW